MATSSETYFAPSWADMSKEEREATGKTKQEYNRSTGQGRFTGTTPDISNYDTTGYGAGSGKDTARISRADLLNLEKQGYSREEIMSYVDDEAAKGTKTEGGKAQALLNSWIADLSKPKPEPDPDSSIPTPVPTPDPTPNPQPQPTPTPDPEPNPTPNPEPTPGPAPQPQPDPQPQPMPEIPPGTNIEDSFNDINTGIQDTIVDNGSVAIVGDGNSAVAGNSTVENVGNRETNISTTIGGDNINYGIQGSDLSTNNNNFNMFNAGGEYNATSRFENMLDQALNFGALGQAGQIPAGAQGISPIVGDFSGVPRASDKSADARDRVDASRIYNKSQGDLRMNHMFGDFWFI